MKYKTWFCVAALLLNLPALAQSSLLLEACNNIDDRSKRLACLQEATKGISQPVETKPTFQNLKRSMLAVQGAVGAGINFSIYQNLILDPSKELAIFKSENPAVNPEALTLLDKAVTAYKDAETLWHADIYSSQDAGIFFGGKVLPYDQLGLGGLISRYGIPTSSVLTVRTVNIGAALPMIWRFAKQSADAGFEILSGPKVELKSKPKNGQSGESATSGQQKPNEFDGLFWLWPTKGSVLAKFCGAARQGIDIDGNEGDSVVAASDGRVVYSALDWKGTRRTDPAG